MTFTPKEIRSIIEVIEESGWEEARLVTPEVTLVLSKSGAMTLGDGAGEVSAPPATLAPAAPAGEPAATVPPESSEFHAAEAESPTSVTTAPVSEDVPEGATQVTAPSLGIFWRSPKPGAPPFVDVGATVTPESTVCIVEVMKLMNHVKAGVRGRVVAIHVPNGEMVEHGQPLVSIEPEGD